MSKTNPGRFFEDFRLGQVIAHATPRTVTAGDVAVYTALHGPRFALFSSDEFAKGCGFDRAPLDSLLVFHVVFGKTVADISLNAVANLGYAEGRVLAPVFPGDTLTATSEVIGLRASSGGDTGIVYVRTTGRNQAGGAVIEFIRWVLVRKGDADAPVQPTVVPEFATAVRAQDLVVPSALSFAGYDFGLSGSAHALEDYAIGERIDHLDGMTLQEAEHQLATRLYQNTAKVHFNQFERGKSPAGRRLVYGGVVISTAKALSFQRAGERRADPGDQRGSARQPLLRQGDAVRLVGGAGHGDAVGRRGRAAAAAGAPPRTGPATTSPTRTRAAATCPRWSSTSIIGRPCPGGDELVGGSRFEATSVFVADLPLCQVRLQDDARWPWLVLLPRGPGCENSTNSARSIARACWTRSRSPWPRFAVSASPRAGRSKSSTSARSATWWRNFTSTSWAGEGRRRLARAGLGRRNARPLRSRKPFALGGPDALRPADAWVALTTRLRRPAPPT
jgi:2-methylfumaryl-CoA hydratase